MTDIDTSEGPAPTAEALVDVTTEALRDLKGLASHTGTWRNPPTTGTQVDIDRRATEVGNAAAEARALALRFEDYSRRLTDAETQIQSFGREILSVRKSVAETVSAGAQRLAPTAAIDAELSRLRALASEGVAVSEAASAELRRRADELDRAVGELTALSGRLPVPGVAQRAHRAFAAFTAAYAALEDLRVGLREPRDA